jgi:hypothetical protein
MTGTPSIAASPVKWQDAARGRFDERGRDLPPGFRRRIDQRIADLAAQAEPAGVVDVSVRQGNGVDRPYAG